MRIFNLTFRKEKKGFFLVLRETGRTNGHTVRVKNLIEPDFSFWDKKQQAFMQPTENAIHNNKVLQGMKARYQQLIDEYAPQTLADLKEIVRTGKCRKNTKAQTFGELVQEKIELEKNKGTDDAKAPSQNYRNYVTLLHKLETEGQIINVPAIEINNRHFEKFGVFLKAQQGKARNNYVSVMKRFYAVHNYAYQKEKVKHRLTYKFMNDAPTKDAPERTVPTLREYKRLVKVNLEKVTIKNNNTLQTKQMYLDFCIFMYEMKIRPCDLLNLHYNNIKTNDINGKLYICYTPIKKKNYTERRKVKNCMTPKAIEIMQKYQGISKAGYIFPFKMNETFWIFDNDAIFEKWCNKRNYILQQINKFLKAAAKQARIKTQRFSLYSLRNARITHEIGEGKKSIMMIAKEAGTSLTMIDKHYFTMEAAQ